MNVKTRDTLYAVVRVMQGKAPHVISIHPLLDTAETYAGQYKQHYIDKGLPSSAVNFNVQAVTFYEQ